MRNRTILLLLLPGMLAAAGLAAGWLRPRERAARLAGRPPGRPHVWALTLLGALLGLLVGVAVGTLGGMADHHRDLGADAMDGTFLLVPGMLMGLAAGIGRWAVVRAERRRRVRLRLPGRRRRR
ncbi:hypothetical protein [Arsenicicoccus dermatophilus]|uniref:hypothetical protein n=1 Tax=Arsenicicoccus dermatophilus TaxID=1076331 RepID=UPI0039171B34